MAMRPSCHFTGTTYLSVFPFSCTILSTSRYLRHSYLFTMEKGYGDYIFYLYAGVDGPDTLYFADKGFRWIVGIKRL